MSNPTSPAQPPASVHQTKQHQLGRRFAGCGLMGFGLVGLACFSIQIATRRSSYTITGSEEYTLQDNLRAFAPAIVISLLYLLVGFGVLRRWRGMGIPTLILSAIALLILAALGLILLLRLTGSCPFPV